MYNIHHSICTCPQTIHVPVYILISPNKIRVPTCKYFQVHSISQTSYFFKEAGWSTKLTWYAYDLTWISKHDLLSYKVWITTKNSINFNFKIYTDLEVFFLWRFILSKNGHGHPCSPLKMHTPLTRYWFTTDMRTSVYTLGGGGSCFDLIKVN